MSRPRLLALFCGAGGDSMGYYRAGFDVVGVDLHPQPHYPFPFVCNDALWVLEYGILTDDDYGLHVSDFDAIHAGPPCQEHSRLKSIAPDQDTGWMLNATLDLLRRLEIPWVCENVVGAPLPNAATLDGRYGTEFCGASFGLQVARHRLFESSFHIEQPAHRPHPALIYSPAGHGDPSWRNRHENPELSGPGYADRCREAMGIDWMNRDELSQAIPPAYTEFIGTQLRLHLEHGKTEDVVSGRGL